jgi:hypothetical protein
MGYAGRTKVGMLVLVIIIGLLALDLYADTVIFDLNPYYIAGLISVVFGVAIFLIDFILFIKWLSNPLVIIGWLLQILIILVGLSLIYGPFFMDHVFFAMIFYIVVLVLVIGLFKGKERESKQPFLTY